MDLGALTSGGPQSDSLLVIITENSYIGVKRWAVRHSDAFNVRANTLAKARDLHKG